MHISEGVLNTQELLVGAVIGGAMLIYAYRKLEFNELTKVAFFSALFFIFSFIHIPLGPTSLHLLGSGLLGYLLGSTAPLAIFIALLFQGLLFGYGGITTLGINLAIMALPALIIHLLFRQQHQANFIKYFTIGFLGVILASFFLSLTLWLNGEAFQNIAKLVFAANLPLAAIEGLIAMFLLKFFEKTTFFQGAK